MFVSVFFLGGRDSAIKDCLRALRIAYVSPSGYRPHAYEF